MIGANAVILNASVDTLGDLVERSYFGASLLPDRCAHDFPGRIQVRVNMSQWIQVVQDSPQPACACCSPDLG